MFHTVVSQWNWTERGRGFLLCCIYIMFTLWQTNISHPPTLPVRGELVMIVSYPLAMPGRSFSLGKYSEQGEGSRKLRNAPLVQGTELCFPFTPLAQWGLSLSLTGRHRRGRRCQFPQEFKGNTTTHAALSAGTLQEPVAAPASPYLESQVICQTDFMPLDEVYAQKGALQVWKPWNGQDILVLLFCIHRNIDILYYLTIEGKMIINLRFKKKNNHKREKKKNPNKFFSI